jgi:hypothetical protein
MCALHARRLSTETHAVAQRKQEQMEKMRKAFGLGEVRVARLLAAAAAAVVCCCSCCCGVLLLLLVSAGAAIGACLAHLLPPAHRMATPAHGPRHAHTRLLRNARTPPNTTGGVGRGL